MISADRPALLLMALIVEAVLGYPQRLVHPVSLVGRLIGWLERCWNRGTYRRAGGVMLVLVLVGVGGGIGALVEYGTPGWSGAIAVVVIATTGLAQRSLYDHVIAVAGPLMTGDLQTARHAVSMIVGRDTLALDSNGIAAAAIETLAESFCDGVVAPAFWFLLLGLPGLFVFKCISTADSMVGHRDTRYIDFGWASARLDDLMNFVPARIAGLLICIVARRGWRVMWRDAGNHLSPNSGWPESAMAGALSVQLGGGAAYDGQWIARAALGSGARPVAADIARGLAIYCRACAGLWVVAGALIWMW